MKELGIEIIKIIKLVIVEIYKHISAKNETIERP